MAYVLFVVYIPNEKKETEDAQAVEPKDTVKPSSEGDAGGVEAEVGVVDRVSPESASETSFKTAEETSETADLGDAAGSESVTAAEHTANKTTNLSEDNPETTADNTAPESADNTAPESADNTAPESADNTASESADNTAPESADNTAPESADNTASESADASTDDKKKEDENTNKDGGEGEDNKGENEDDEGEDGTLENFLGKGNFAERLKETLHSLQVQNDVWQVSDAFIQISFVEESGTRCEDIITRLSNIGIGREPNSTLSVFPSTVHLQYDADGDESLDEAKMMNGTYLSEEEKENEFMMSVKSRLTVAQVVSSVERNARLTFDYVMLIFLASWIAALGLGENSSVVLVASMLISPLMGPILAVIFGTVVKNNELRNLGLKSEVIGLLICLAFGLLSGFVYAGLGVHGQLLGNSDSWPTSEMSSRGVHRSLVAGVLIAIPSGAGVALSILGGNAGSLVGVAISASLLPPAVNAGMLWSLSLSAAIRPPAVDSMLQEFSNETIQLSNVSVPTNTEWRCPPFVDNAYIPTYSCNMAVEAAILGTISLLLTFLNILAIFLVGMMVLKLKEVAPHTSPSSTEHFFRKDLKVARESYQTTKGAQSVALGKKFLEEYKKQNLGVIGEEEEEDNEIKENKKILIFKHVLEKVENDADVRNVISSLPSSSNTTPFSFQLKPEFTNAERNILQKEDSYYKTFATDDTEVDPKARVYRTIHAYDPHPLAPTSPTLPSLRNRRHQLVKRRSDFFFYEASRPRVSSVGSKPRTPGSNQKGKRTKKDLKVIIPEPVVTIQEPVVEKTEPAVEYTKQKVTFVPIEEGQESMFADQKPRFEVETVNEKEIKGETPYTPEHVPLLPQNKN